VHTSHSYLNLPAVRRAEESYRKTLQTQPDNTATRISLAWCLFIQSLYSSGIEAALSAVDDTPAVRANTIEYQAVNRNSETLLDEFFGQISIVKHLSVHKNDVFDTTRLEELIRLSGLQEVARRAEEQWLVRLDDLSREIMNPGKESVYAHPEAEELMESL